MTGKTVTDKLNEDLSALEAELAGLVQLAKTDMDAANNCVSRAAKLVADSSNYDEQRKRAEALQRSAGGYLLKHSIDGLREKIERFSEASERNAQSSRIAAWVATGAASITALVLVVQTGISLLSFLKKVSSP